MRNLQKHGIEAHAFIMIGVPSETEETFKQTMDFIPKLRPDSVIFSIFTPYPGSDLYYECKDEGIISGDFDLALYNHQSPLNCFTKHIPKERFYELRKKAFKFVDKYNKIPTQTSCEIEVQSRKDLNETDYSKVVDVINGLEDNKGVLFAFSG